MTETHGGNSSHIISKRQGSLLHLTLNRPEALNALSIEMLTELRNIVAGLDEQNFICVLIDGAGERGMCGGGDVKVLSRCSRAEAEAFLSIEYQADLGISRLETPVVSIMTGITMGGGIGIGGHASHRVVTESSRLAMPETRIGLAPDVGANSLLAAAPGFYGEYLATSAASMNAADALLCGFADWYVASTDLASVQSRLAAGDDPTSVLEEFSRESGTAPLEAQKNWIDECFSLGSVVEALHALEEHPNAAARATAAEIRSLSPIAVAVSFWAVRLARRGDALAEIFARDVRTMATLLDDFDGREGIRAQLIDKDKNPRWKPQRLEDVTVAQLEHVLGAEVLELLTQNRV